MPRTARLGNDVVDLNEAGVAGKAGDQRFVERVFTAEERAWIADGADPDLALWRLWSAKEAAYKAAYKAAGKTVADLVFAHRSFEVDANDGVVRYGDQVFSVAWHHGPGWLHCLALETTADATADHAIWEVAALMPGPQSSNVEAAATAARTQSVAPAQPSARPSATRSTTPSTTPSAQVRALACRMLARAGWADAAIVRPLGTTAARPGPPEAHIGGERLEGVEVSLSHDGQWVAAALAWP